MRSTRHVVAAAALATALAVVGGASASLNAVPGSRATAAIQAIGPNELKPAECAALTPTRLETGLTGTNADELQLGTAGADPLEGRAGDDCVLGGGGADAIDGGAGIDVCVGGPGTDTFTRCETAVQ